MRNTYLIKLVNATFVIVVLILYKKSIIISVNAIQITTLLIAVYT